MKIPTLSLSRRNLSVLGAAAVVAVVFACSSVFGGGDDTVVGTPQPAAPAPTTLSTTAPAPIVVTPAAPPAGPAPATTAPTPVVTDEHGEHGDDGVSSETGDEPAVITTGETDPKEAALNFLTKYLNTQNQSPQGWRDSFMPLVSAEYQATLAELQPEDVGVTRVGTPTRAYSGGDRLFVVEVPAATGGTITVTLNGSSGQWLVSDLSRSRQ
ncbi:MAG TPA: hypothetical protein VK453_25590 [Micromonosporaceae bacterium]|nr:hypothetical protein [Micromonosporaceae bacterium]